MQTVIKVDVYLIMEAVTSKARKNWYVELERDWSHYNPNNKNKISIVFDDIIAAMIQNKKLNSIVTEFFIRGWKWNISLVLITQSYFRVPKDIRLNTTHFIITKILSKRELQQLGINHSSDISTEEKCTVEPYSFFVNDTTLSSNNLLRFRKNLFGVYDKNHDS